MLQRQSRAPTFFHSLIKVNQSIAWKCLSHCQKTRTHSVRQDKTCLHTKYGDEERAQLTQSLTTTVLRFCTRLFIYVRYTLFSCYAEHLMSLVTKYVIKLSQDFVLFVYFISKLFVFVITNNIRMKCCHNHMSRHIILTLGSPHARNYRIT